MSQRALAPNLQTPALAPAQGGVLQRQCACGQHTPGGGECETCRKKHEGNLQRRAVSDVTTQSDVAAVPASVQQTLAAPGQPLDRDTRTFMESRFNHDFSGVRVHTDERAAKSAQEVDALAYTVGQKVVFGPAQFAPATSRGSGLIAHELAHTIQQSGRADQGPLRIAEDVHQEHEADRAASAIERGDSVAVGNSLALPGVQRKGGTAGGFFANIGRAIADFFTGSEPDYDAQTLKTYLDLLANTNDIEDDFDSDNKARAVVSKGLYQGKEMRIRLLLIREMLSGATLDEDEQAILTILEAMTPTERKTASEQIGLEKLYDKIDGKELDRLYAMYPILDSLHPRSKDESRTVTIEEYIDKWEKERGRTMTSEEKKTLGRGCIGITALNLGTIENPDLSHCFGTFEQARESQRKMNDFLALNFPVRKAVLFSKRFYSGGNEYKPDPKTGQVDMSGYNYEAKPGLTNFDYGLYDEKTGKWWHANHCDTTLISKPDCGGAMEVYESNLTHYSRPLLDFDKQVFCVGVAVGN